MRSEPPETENERKMQSLDSLARVLKNGLATASDRQRRLIQYLATEELEGRGDRLKAVSIATDVLGRSADFDPQTDSIVRVEMGRMRRTTGMEDLAARERRFYQRHPNQRPQPLEKEEVGEPVRKEENEWNAKVERGFGSALL